MKKLILYIALIIVSATSFSVAQDLQVQIIMSPRPSPYISDWQDKSETIQLVVTNLTDEDVNFRIGAKVFAGSQFEDNLQAATDINSMPIQTILGFESIMFDGIDIVPYQAIEFYNDIEQSVIRTGKLPSRDYTICLSLYHDVTGVELTAPVCKPFFLDSYQQPNLIYPLDNSDIPISTLQGQLFRWTPITPNPTGIVNYTLFGMRVDEWQQPMQAFNTNQPFFEIDLPLQTQSIWPPDFDLPAVGETIIWSVRATDEEGKPIGEQDGIANPFVFHVVGSGLNNSDLCNCKPITEGATIRLASQIGSPAISDDNTIYITSRNPEKALLAHELAHVVQQNESFSTISKLKNESESFNELLEKIKELNPDVEIRYNWSFYGINEDGSTFTDQSNNDNFIIDYPNLKEGRLSVAGTIICAETTCQFKSESKVIVDVVEDNELDDSFTEFDDIKNGEIRVVPVDTDNDGEIDYIDFKSPQRQTPKTDFGNIIINFNPELVIETSNDMGYSMVKCYPKSYIFNNIDESLQQWQGRFYFIYSDSNGTEYNGFRDSDNLIYAPHSTGNLKIQYIGTFSPDGVHPLFTDTLGVSINFSSSSSNLQNAIDYNTQMIYNPFETKSDNDVINFDYPVFGGNASEVFPLFSDSDFETIEVELIDYEYLRHFEAFRNTPPLLELPEEEVDELDLGDWAIKFEPADGSSPIFISSEQSNGFYFLPPCSGILDVNFKGKKKDKDGKEDALDLNYKKIVLSNPSVNKNKGKVNTKDKKVNDLTESLETDSPSQELFIGPVEKLERSKLKLTDMTNELDYTEIILPTPKLRNYKTRPVYYNSRNNENPLFGSTDHTSENVLYEGKYSKSSTNLSQTNYYVMPSSVRLLDESGNISEILINQNEKTIEYSNSKRNHDHIGNYNFSVFILKEELHYRGSKDGVNEYFTPTIIRSDYTIPESEISKTELIDLLNSLRNTKYGKVKKSTKYNGESCGSSPFVNISNGIEQHNSAPLVRIFVEGIKSSEVSETQLKFATVGSNELSDNPDEIADLIEQWFTDNKIENNKLISAKVAVQTINQNSTESFKCSNIGPSFNSSSSTYTEVPKLDFWSKHISSHKIQLESQDYRDILAKNLFRKSILVNIESKSNSIGQIQWLSPESINLKIFSSKGIDLNSYIKKLSSSDRTINFTPPTMFKLFDENSNAISEIIEQLENISPLENKNLITGGQFDLSNSNLSHGALYFALIEESKSPDNQVLVPFWIPKNYEAYEKNNKSNIPTDFSFKPGFKIISPKSSDEYELLNTDYKFTRLDNDKDIYYTLYYENSSTNNPEIEKDCDSIAANTENPFGPNSSEEWIALRDSLRQVESDLENWKKRCPQEDVKDEVRENNIKILNHNIETLKNWARELGISLPENTECNFRECCPPNGDCCEGIDPNTPEGRAAYLEKMRCISRKLNELNGTMNADMGNFIDQMNFWNRREDSRNTWIMYDWYFSNVEWIMSGGPITDAIDYMKEKTGFNDVVEWIGREAWNRFCSGLNLTPEQCEQAKQLLRDIQEVKEKYDDAKEAADAVKEIIMAARTGGGFPPALIIKMTAMMAGAVAELTGDMVEFYNTKFMEMSGTAKSVMHTMLCLKQYYTMIAQMKEKCGNFCEEAISNLESDVARLEKEKDRVRDAFIESERNSAREAEESIDEAIRRILSLFNDPMGQNRLICCSEGNETLIFNYPEDKNKNDCAKMIANQLKLSLGEKYCWLNITVTVICTQRNTEINYEFEVMRERNGDCCPEDIDEIPLGGRSGGDMGTGGEGGVKPPSGGSTAGGGRIRVGGNDGGANNNGGPAGSGHRTTPWQPGPPEDKPPHRGKKGKCKCDIKLTYNGKGLKPNGKIIVEYDDAATIIAAGKCEGDCFKDGNWLVVDPPPMNNFPFINIPPTKFVGTKFSTSKNFGFYIPGQWNFKFFQRCSDGSVCSIGLTIVVKKPKNPDKKGKPDFDIDTTDQDDERCGADTCLQIEYNHYDGKKPTVKKRMFGETITRKSTGFTKLNLDTECLEVCLMDPNKITWYIRRPDGRLDTKVGINLYSILYEFDLKGKYEICIIEEKGCSKGMNRAYSRTFYVRVE